MGAQRGSCPDIDTPDGFANDLPSTDHNSDVAVLALLCKFRSAMCHEPGVEFLRTNFFSNRGHKKLIQADTMVRAFSTQGLG